MSTPRHNWWSFAINMATDYPARKREYDSLHRQSTAATVCAVPGGGSGYVARITEHVAARQLPQQEQRELDAVQRAIDRTKALKDGDMRMKVVSMTLFSRSRTVSGAAMQLYISESMAQMYRWQFLMTVGFMYGLIDEAAFTEQVLKRARRVTSGK